MRNRASPSKQIVSVDARFSRVGSFHSFRLPRSDLPLTEVRWRRPIAKSRQHAEDLRRTQQQQQFRRCQQVFGRYSEGGVMVQSLRFVFCTVFVLLSVSAFAQDDWTRFRGPNGAGLSNAANLPVEFGPEKSVVWKTALPPGHSSPVLARNTIFVTAHTPIAAKDKTAYQLFVIALDRKTGRELWRREIPHTHKGRLENVNGPASASPVTDGDNVYAYFQDFGLIAFTAAGKEKWRMPLPAVNIFYGYGASPILADNVVILPVDQDLGSYLLAVDKNTGKVKWKTDRPNVISGYSTPTLWRPPTGPKQLLIPESFQLSAYSLADGKRVWWVRGLACEMKSVVSYDNEHAYINGWGFPLNQPGKQIPTIPFAEGLKKYDRNQDGVVGRDEIAGDDPISKVLHPSYGFDAFDLNRDARLDAKDWEVFRAMMASENGLLAIKLGGQGDMTEQAIRWRYQRPVPQVPSTLLYQGALFMVNDSGILISFNPTTGQVIKQGRLKGAIDKYFASPVGADGKVYLISQDGTVSVVKAAGEWDVLAVNALGDEVFATPAIAEGKIYVRTKSALYCFGQAANAARAGER
jgi:outer membrane protein assembly factor BamB